MARNGKETETQRVLVAYWELPQRTLSIRGDVLLQEIAS